MEAMSLKEQVLELASCKFPWLSAWRHVAKLSQGVALEDQRFVPIQRLILECDRCFETGDSDGFQKTVRELETLKNL